MSFGNRVGGAGAVAVLAAAAFGASAAAAGDVASCTDLNRILLSAEAAGAADGTTIRLADGREVRLAGIAPLEGDSEAVRLSTAALHALVTGRRISLHGAREETDRYGRLVAQVTVAGDVQRWVQAALVAGGTARVALGAEAASCTKALLEQEKQARIGKIGIWSKSDFAVRPVQDIERLQMKSGLYTVVEGTVRHVSESGGRILLDFGRRFDRDFGIVIPREAQKGFAEVGVDLRALSGKRVRARGVLFDWGGPALELRVPAALELLGAEEA